MVKLLATFLYQRRIDRYIIDMIFSWVFSLGHILRSFSPLLLAAFLSIICLSKIRNILPIELLTIPIIIIIVGQFAEWFAHKYILHKKTIFKDLYAQHMIHHGLFRKNFYWMSSNNFKNIFVPFQGLLIIFILIFPVLLLIGSSISKNCGLLLGSGSLVYFIFYEITHFLHHTKNNSKILNWYSKWHLIHHNPSNTKFNFNVSFPIFDKIFNTFKSSKFQSFD